MWSICFTLEGLRDFWEKQAAGPGIVASSTTTVWNAAAMDAPALADQESSTPIIRES